MQSDERYLDRTPDLVAKVRAMREAAEKEMNRFTQFSDYDVRRVVGQKPKEPVASGQTATNPEPAEIPARPASSPLMAESPSAPVVSGESEEGA